MSVENTNKREQQQFRTMSVSLPSGLAAAVRALAEREGRPLSWTVKDLLALGLQFRETQPGPLHAAAEGAA